MIDPPILHYTNNRIDKPWKTELKPEISTRKQNLDLPFVVFVPITIHMHLIPDSRRNSNQQFQWYLFMIWNWNVDRIIKFHNQFIHIIECIW